MAIKRMLKAAHAFLVGISWEALALWTAITITYLIAVNIF